MYATVAAPKNFWVKLVKFLGPQALLTWVLLMLAFGSVVSGLTEVVKGLDYGYALLIMGLGISVGWLMALFPLRERLALVFGMFLGIEIVFLRVGHLESAIFELGGAVLSLLGQIGTWLWVGLRALMIMAITREPVAVEYSIHWMTLPRVYLSLGEDLSILFNRAFHWLMALVEGSGSYDPVATALIWGLGLWLCAWWAGWAVNRHHRPLVAMLPGGILGAFILAYAWASTFTLLPMLGFTLLLMALEQQRARELHWHGSGTDFSCDLWGDLVGVAILVSTLLIVVAAISPSITIERFQDLVEWVDELTRPAENVQPVMAESLGIEQQPQKRLATPIEQAQVTTLPRRHLIGSPPELSQMVIMAIRTNELPGMPEMLALAEEIQAPRHYWRSITYDHYYGQGWATSNTSIAKYEAGELAMTADLAYHTTLRQEIQTVGIQDDVIYVDGKLVSTDQPFEIYWRPPLEKFAATTEANTYRADSLVLNVTAEDLRNAGSEIPDWLAERYLRLPDSLPERVHALALELTATEATAYDRARAIELYLRKFPYTLDVPTPPYNHDLADYFLFELQKGYCDYYATALVVLARAAGLPARLVIGYATGTYNAESARYIITAADAHAWPEIYFPDIGWVEFEPTAGLPGIDRTLIESPDFDRGDWSGFEPLPPLPEARVNTPLLGSLFLWLGGALLVTVLLMMTVDGAFLLMWGTTEAMVMRLYHRLQHYQRSLRAPLHAGYTPHEVAASLVQRLAEISQRRDMAAALLPPAADEVRYVVDKYVQAWYSPHPLTRADRRQLVRTWWQLRWRLWLARVLRNPRRERAPMPVVKRITDYELRIMG